MRYSHEIIYHFTCDKCELWWSIAGTNINVEKKQAWYCPWCGHKHTVPYKDLTILANLDDV